MKEIVELRVSYRYLKEHPWVVQGITGFLSAYFMEKPGFQVLRHKDELETGMHVWICELPPDMNLPKLLKRLTPDIPPAAISQLPAATDTPPQYLIDLPNQDNDKSS
jgi:hypothetical protein